MGGGREGELVHGLAVAARDPADEVKALGGDLEAGDGLVVGGGELEAVDQLLLTQEVHVALALLRHVQVQPPALHDAGRRRVAGGRGAGKRGRGQAKRRNGLVVKHACQNAFVDEDEEGGLADPFLVLLGALGRVGVEGEEVEEAVLVLGQPLSRDPARKPGPAAARPARARSPCRSPPPPIPRPRPRPRPCRRNRSSPRRSTHPAQRGARGPIGPPSQANALQRPRRDAPRRGQAARVAARSASSTPRPDSNLPGLVVLGTARHGRECNAGGLVLRLPRSRRGYGAEAPGQVPP